MQKHENQMIPTMTMTITTRHAHMLTSTNFQKHEHQMNPIAAQKLKADKFDPRRSSVMAAINASERV